MDEVLLTGDDEPEIEALKENLNKTFQIKHLGQAHYFLVLEILHVKDRLIMTQKKFTKEI